MTTKFNSKTTHLSLHRLTAAALILPGLLQPIANAAEDDSVDFQYSHYQEGRRQIDLSVDISDPVTGKPIKTPIPSRRNPIEVDSLHGSARISLSDRVKFAFNYTEDTWSGATPIGSAPTSTSAHHSTSNGNDPNGLPIFAGASPFATLTQTYADDNGNAYKRVVDPATREVSYVPDQIQHVMSYASPETRKQGDFKLGYEWDEAAITIGGGISLERDYESRFANLGGRMDFNNKLTTVNLGLSYTNSDINAILDSLGSHYFDSSNYEGQIDTDEKNGLKTLHGTRQDWTTHLNLTQVLSKATVADFGLGYTRSSGFLENPYKLTWLLFQPTDGSGPQDLPDGISFYRGKAAIEQRPDIRNQWNLTTKITQYVEPLDAALHLGYNFFSDDWGIDAHTFDLDWVQPIGWGWQVTPRVRYYSQEAANFYTRLGRANKIEGISLIIPQTSFSSDQRLSGYGTLSGGLTVSKQFAKGISMEAGFEYYSHQGNLKLGGGGEEDFADFDYWVANAALKVNFDSLGKGISGMGNHAHHHVHPNNPAGVMFAHTLEKAGDMMMGYRFMHNRQAGNFLHGDKAVAQDQIIAKSCPGSVRTDDQGITHFDGGCSLLPKEMSMSMHMLDLMYAPTDWLTLMLMPQFVNMQMPLSIPDNIVVDGGHQHVAHLHESGGIGDTGMYALFKLFDHPNHHIHTSLGFTAPTGDVGIKLKESSKNLDGAYIHYGMQLGSGTWDFKPSLTYLGNIGDWNWGAQILGTKRIESKNASGYALGDIFEGSVWGGYDITRWLSASVRVAYTWQDRLKGRYPRSTRTDNTLAVCNKADFTFQDDTDGDGIGDGPFLFDQVGYNQCLNDLNIDIKRRDAADRPSPMDFPRNYGGQYVDLGLGLSATIPDSAFVGNRLSFEWVQPVYTDVNGYQLDRDGALSFTWSYGF
ncbi:MAG: DUF3570 domain-containing protein [Methylococcaceae bacterium]|nr:DUF3570 domain-containing protein [Methylococcaceae bacterium]